MFAIRQTRILFRTDRLLKCNGIVRRGKDAMSTAAAQEIEKILPPSLEGSKEFPPKIVKIVDDISNLTLIEVSELNELLKIKLNISDIPMMVGGGIAPGASAAQAEDEAPASKEQTEFTVKLTAFKPDSKVKLIKAIKLLMPNLNLVKAKGFVESVPQIVRQEIPKTEAEELSKTLTEAGGTVVIE
uniref:39S ribosomal protein L12, mitochondrial-like n=1 Tax=Styela clava TaxID=7725 RepID=UPI001939D793|nr:39S ribosomal protein L12, mitochondrial-like [Styela clava]